jgi:hypothetical protein
MLFTLDGTLLALESQVMRQRTLVLAIENTPVFIRCSVQLANGVQMEHSSGASFYAQLERRESILSSRSVLAAAQRHRSATGSWSR